MRFRRVPRENCCRRAWSQPIATNRRPGVLPLSYVNNVVDAICKASLSEAAIGRTYNIVDDGDVTVEEYITEFIGVTGAPARVVRVPYAFPNLLTAGYEMAAGLGREGLRRTFEWHRDRWK